MVCYLNQAVISKNGGFIAIEKIELPKEEYQLFLINTNVSRSTGPLVEKFQAFYEAVENRRRINEEYIPIVNQAIDSLLKISGQRKLLQTNPLLERSIHNRFPYLDPLNHLQVELMKKYRRESENAKVLRGIQLTINGISAGLRNSG